MSTFFSIELYNKRVNKMNSMIIVIPSLEPDFKLVNLLKTIRQTIPLVPVLIIDDGSGPTYQELFQQVEVHYASQVIHHSENKGKGAALKTAMLEILASYPEVQWMITVDSDGQHSVEDIQATINLAVTSPDSLVLGTREFHGEVPFRSQFGNRLTRNVMHLITGINVSDTQTGLRVIPRSFIEPLLKVKGERFEYETNMLLEAKKRQWDIYSQPIATTYIENNSSSHFRMIRDSIAIYSVLVKYIISSIMSFVVDITVYAALIHFLNFLSLSNIVLASLFARALSSLINYLLNRDLVFKSNQTYSFIKYYLLVICQLFLSATLVYLVHSVFNWHGVVGVKVTVDSFLFILSYFVQKNYIFSEG